MIRLTWADADGTQHNVTIPKHAKLHTSDGTVAAVILLCGDTDGNGQADVTGQAVGELPAPWNAFVHEAQLPIGGGFKTVNVPIKEFLEKVVPPAIEAAAIPLALIPIVGPAGAQMFKAGALAVEKILL